LSSRIATLGQLPARSLLSDSDSDSDSDSAAAIPEWKQLGATVVPTGFQS